MLKTGDRVRIDAVKRTVLARLAARVEIVLLILAAMTAGAQWRPRLRGKPINTDAL